MTTTAATTDSTSTTSEYSSPPTTYELQYDDPCSVEDTNCETGDCGNKTQFTARPTVFCKEITGNSSLSIAGAARLGATTMAAATVTSPSITVGGQTFRPTLISTIYGPHLVLAAY